MTWDLVGIIAIICDSGQSLYFAYTSAFILTTNAGIEFLRLYNRFNQIIQNFF